MNWFFFGIFFWGGGSFFFLQLPKVFLHFSAICGVDENFYSRNKISVSQALAWAERKLNFSSHYFYVCSFPGFLFCSRLHRHVTCKIPHPRKGWRAMPLLSWRKMSEIICAVNEIGSLLYGMQLISWCSFSSALFTVKLRQCIICIIMSQECVLILTASFYYCCSQPWINPAWNLES